jgi:hypothetical protein
MYTETFVNVGLYSRLCLNLFNPPKRQLVTIMVVSLTAAKFKAGRPLEPYLSE